MRIGIDISQIIHEGTGVATYVRRMVAELLRIDYQNDYVLFGASLRQQRKFYEYFNTVQYLSPRAKLVVIPLPPTLLDILWNRLHVIPIEQFTGPLDVFWSSDWMQPPLKKARGVTTIHDVSFLHYPASFDSRITAVQKRRLALAVRECQVFLCDSEATRRDAMKFLDIEAGRLHVVYPGR